VQLAVFRALRLARSFASAGTPAFRIGYEGHVAVPPAFFVVALALASVVQRHIGLADPVFRGLADGIAVATVPCTVLVIAVVVTNAISYKTVRALRAQVAVITVLAIKITIKVEALLVTDTVVDQGVQASGGRVAHVAVTAVEFTRTDITLRIAVSVAHLPDAFRTAVIAVAAIEGAQWVVALGITHTVTYFERCAAIGAVRAVLDLTGTAVIAFGIADSISLSQHALW
jgi:hypothetical protein